MLHSEHEPENALFRANKNTGLAQFIPIPKSDGNGTDYEDSELEIPEEFKTDSFLPASFITSSVEIPATGYM